MDSGTWMDMGRIPSSWLTWMGKQFIANSIIRYVLHLGQGVKGSPPPHLLPSREGWAEIKKIKASPTFLSFHPQGWGVWIYLITTRRIFLSPTWSPCPNRRPMCDLFLVSPFHVARGQNHKAVHSQAFFFQTLVTPPYMFGRMFLLCASFLVQCFWCWQVCIEISSLWREKIEFFDLVSNVRSKYRPLG